MIFTRVIYSSNVYRRMFCPVSVTFTAYNQFHMQINKSIRPGLNTANLWSPPRILAWLILSLLGGAQAALAASTELDTDMARLQRGEILTQTIHSEKSGGAARVTAMFHGEVDEVWDVIGYCENEFIYVRGLELCELVKPGLEVMHKHHRVNNNWYTPTIDFTFEASRTSPTHGEFRLLGGNLKVLEGQWKFQPLADTGKIIVVHEIRIRSRFPAPRWLVRSVLKKDLPDMVACVRGLARASGDDDRVAIDLARCPGDTTRLAK